MNKPTKSWRDAVLQLQNTISSLFPTAPELVAPPSDRSVFEMEYKPGPCFVFRTSSKASAPDTAQYGSSELSNQEIIWDPSNKYDEKAFAELPRLKQLLDEALPLEHSFENQFDELPVYVHYNARPWRQLIATLRDTGPFNLSQLTHPSVRPVMAAGDSYEILEASSFSLEDFDLLSPDLPVPSCTPETSSVAIEPASSTGLHGIEVDTESVKNIDVSGNAWLFVHGKTNQCKIDGPGRLWRWSDGVWIPG